VELDDVKRTITAEATVTYHNASPDALEYLWVQLDQNYLSHNADSRAAPNTKRGIDPNKITYSALDRLLAYEDYDGEMKISKLTDAKGEALPHSDREDDAAARSAQPLAAGADFVFKIAWSYPINDCERINARTGYEFFKEDGNCIYTIAQWFPRMAAYTDYAGWINKQFLGTGEFTLEFGNYTVRLTVPDDHLVAATGALQNAEAVLTETQRERLKKAQGETKKPMFIVTPEEAKAAEKGKPKGKKTWVFQADNVRDFAFASSRKFAWDAMAVEGATIRQREWQAGDGDVALSEGRHAAVGQVLDACHRAHDPGLFALHLCLSVSRRVVGQRAGGRHGIPDDLFQRPAPRKRRHLPGAHEVCAHRRRDS
jgi:hypothetical protein